MKLITQSKNWLLVAGLLLGSGIVCLGQSERPRTTAAAQQEKEEDWKSKFSKEERDALARPDGANDRIKTYIRFADLRLKSARDLMTREEYTAAGEQIVVYTALIADAGQFTKASVPKKDKAHKTLETNLREQLRTLEGVRRDSPSAQAEIFEKAIKIVNQVRRQSLNLLLGADGGILSETDKQE